MQQQRFTHQLHHSDKKQSNIQTAQTQIRSRGWWLPTSPSTSNFPTKNAEQTKPKTKPAAQRTREDDYTPQVIINNL